MFGEDNGAGEAPSLPSRHVCSSMWVGCSGGGITDLRCVSAWGERFVTRDKAGPDLILSSTLQYPQSVADSSSKQQQFKECRVI